jgi:Neprosin
MAMAPLAPSAHAQVQPQRPEFVPFTGFLASLKSARAAAFVGRLDAKVHDAAEFGKMRSYLLTLYRGASAERSFLLDNQTFDCIPIMQQPSVRKFGLSTIASPPPNSPGDAMGEDMPAEPVKAADEFGNVQECAAGTIPMRRITLEELSGHKTLAEFFQKFLSTEADGHTSVVPTHRWAHAYDYEPNLGGEAVHNVWRPAVKGPDSEVFSLSQQWYSGSLGSGPNQTAEIGWQNYPAKWRTQDPVVFIYWTADNYNKTGCYNLDCPGFVQVDSKLPLGAALTPVSVARGKQSEAYFGYRLHQGNWWAAVGASKSTSRWIGYYPTKIYKYGQMSQYATEFDIGGETVGGTEWPAMGSGQWAYRGLGYAAYDRAILYRNENGGLHAPYLSTTVQGANAHKCYSITFPEKARTDWLTYFYFGGPGGTDC